MREKDDGAWCALGGGGDMQTHKDIRTCGQPAGRAAGAGVQGGQTPPYSGPAWAGGSGRPTRRSPGALSAPPWGMGGFSRGLWSRGGDGRVEGRGAVTTGGRGEARDPLSLSKEAHGLSLDPKGACGSVELSAASPPQLTALGNDAGGGNRGSPPKTAQPLRPRLGPTEHRAGGGCFFLSPGSKSGSNDRGMSAVARNPRCGRLGAASGARRVVAATLAGFPVTRQFLLSIVLTPASVPG